MESYLSFSSTCHPTTTFENDIIKMQEIRSLSSDEKESVAILAIPVNVSDLETSSDYATNMLKQRKLYNGEKIFGHFIRCAYIKLNRGNLQFVRFAFIHIRPSLYPPNLEMQFFLCYNRDFW